MLPGHSCYRQESQAHSMYNTSHQLHHVWSRYCLHDTLLMLLEVCGKPHDYTDCKDFAHRNKHIELQWTERLDAFVPNCYNVWGKTWFHQNANTFNKAKRKVKVKVGKSHRVAQQAAASRETSPALHCVASDGSHPPPPPPMPQAPPLPYPPLVPM